MPVELFVFIAVGGFKMCSRKYNKTQAIKYKYDDEIVEKDYLGRPIDKSSRRRLSRNEARAYATYLRQVMEDEEQLKEWRSRGNVLPMYGQIPNDDGSDSSQASSSSSSSSGSSSNSVAGDFSADCEELDEWRRWSISGAPCYTEQDEQTRANLPKSVVTE
jgi:hypothetical protein